MDIKEKQEAELLDMLEYYTTDVNRRCSSSDYGCFYNPAKVGKQGISDGCAIGRHLTKENQIEADKLGRVANIYAVNAEHLFPKSLRDLGQKFLKKLQSLHDGRAFWCQKGLTSDGKKQVELIVNLFELNITKFEKYI